MNLNRLNRWAILTIVVAGIAACATSAKAQSGIWTGTGFGTDSWTASVQWSASTVANGANDTGTTGIVDNGTSLEKTAATGDPAHFARIQVPPP